MPTSRTETPRRRVPRFHGRRLFHHASSGFTLIELALVILIISVLLGLTLPRLRDSSRSELQAQANRLMLIFRLLRSEAVLNGAPYRLNYDLDRQRYWVTPHEASADLAEFAMEMGKLARGTQLPESIAITDIVLPTLAGKIAQGQIYTVFYPDGTVDPTVIHLASQRDVFTLWLNPMSGKLSLAEGYHDVDYAG
jgi:type II secretion system protein H